MTSDVKRRRDEAGVDRISFLPVNLIDLILQGLSIRDAARTSILSKSWRNIWRNLPKLSFDDNFFLELAANDNIGDELHPVSKTVSNILLLHTGPINKFHLSIPEYLPLNQCHDLDNWIKYVANCGVRKLELFNKLSVAYKLPSYLFSCLKYLCLDNCILHPPLGFGGFRSLINVKLENVIISADMLFGTQLKQLYLRCCSGLEHLRCQFSDNNNLTILKIFGCEGINWQWFERTKNVQHLALMLKSVPSVEGFLSFDKLFGNMPIISVLGLNGSLLKALDPGGGNMEMLVATMRNLKSLYLYRINFNDMAQIKYVLCLIKASPNLRYLHIQLEVTKVKFLGSMLELLLWRSFKECLQSPDSLGLVVGQLETVKLGGLAFSKIELNFIKFLLVSSPSLKWMRLVSNSKIGDPDEVYRISRELLRFPRTSSAAQIIWT